MSNDEMQILQDVAGEIATVVESAADTILLYCFDKIRSVELAVLLF